MPMPYILRVKDFFAEAECRGFRTSARVSCSGARRGRHGWRIKMRCARPRATQRRSDIFFVRVRWAIQVFFCFFFVFLFFFFVLFLFLFFCFFLFFVFVCLVVVCLRKPRPRCIIFHGHAARLGGGGGGGRCHLSICTFGFVHRACLAGSVPACAFAACRCRRSALFAGQPVLGAVGSVPMAEPFCARSRAGLAGN